MDKRYQVFISSTFRDLRDERQAVLKAILETDHMPAGMELFPASDDAAWQLIRDVIDASDYYVLIVGGRYGSLDDTGIGYTEKEYDYAIASGKPVIPLLHKNPNNLPRDKTETRAESWEKLKNFRKKIEKNHTCVYWSTAGDLKANVIVGLTSATKRHPAIGWVRADKIPSDSTVTEILRLRDRIEELEQSAEVENTRPPAGTEDLLQGEDEFEIDFEFSTRKPGAFTNDARFTAQLSFTWNEIFAAVAPKMIHECPQHQLLHAFMRFFEQRAREVFASDEDLQGKHLMDFEFSNDEIETCLVQFRALGLISESVRTRSVKDTATYWTLKPYGDYLMTRLRALRKRAVSRAVTKGKVTPQ